MTIKNSILSTVASIAKDRELNGTIRALKTRRSEFGNELEMMLAGIAMNPLARVKYEAALDKQFAVGIKPSDPFDLFPDSVYYDIAILGGGVHGSIAASIFVQRGYKVMVIEASRPGGAFAVSKNPSFWLNSRNRAGEGGLPSENAALNYMPAAPVQLSQIGGAEFQTNADLAFVTRSTLAFSGADVMIGNATRVSNGYSEGAYVVETENQPTFFAGTVIDAMGLGTQPDRFGGSAPQVMSADKLFARMDDPFPLQGLGRIAVVGGGDTGKCAIECLMGVAPAQHMSTAALDQVDQVDWYARGLPTNCETWREEIRGRYQAIGGFLRQPLNGTARVRVFGQVVDIIPSYKSAVIGERVYDTVIDATSRQRPANRVIGYLDPDDYGLGNAYQGIAQCVSTVSGYNNATWRIGTAAELPFTLAEEGSLISGISENRVALFRLTRRTAQFASTVNVDKDRQRF